jgi:4-hydroxy-tetrahydrodipicolinate reductase
MTIPVIICGALGRMGRAVIDVAKGNQLVAVQAGVIRKGSSEPSSIPLYHDLHTALLENKNSVVIDFSDQSHGKEHLACAEDHRCPIVLATTGHSDDNLRLAKKVSATIPLVIAPNTSLLANLLISFSEIASRSLNNFDVSIIDLHHAHKKDAPSGTALSLSRAVGKHKDPQGIDIHSLRKGRVAGEHTVFFFSDFERLELTHRVADRRVFAEGALLAAQFLFNRAPGLYDMNDVLNLRLTIDK